MHKCRLGLCEKTLKSLFFIMKVLFFKYSFPMNYNVESYLTKRSSRKNAKEKMSLLRHSYNSMREDSRK